MVQQFLNLKLTKIFSKDLCRSKNFPLKKTSKNKFWKKTMWSSRADFQRETIRNKMKIFKKHDWLSSTKDKSNSKINIEIFRQIMLLDFSFLITHLHQKITKSPPVLCPYLIIHEKNSFFLDFAKQFWKLSMILRTITMKFPSRASSRTHLENFLSFISAKSYPKKRKKF